MFSTPYSSHVLAVDHDGTSLVVTYRNGSVYHYPGASMQDYDTMAKHVAKGGSAGDWLNRNIKNRFSPVNVSEDS